MTQTGTFTTVEVDTRAGRVRGIWRGSPAEPVEAPPPAEPVEAPPLAELVEARPSTGSGSAGSASAAFLGIPFAEPPVGDARFAAPVPKAPWDGVLDATASGATPQREALSEVTLIPEPSIPGASTLNVNVFTPRPGEPAAALPVLVYIHGGGFTAGSPASPWYDGAAFNRDGIVTVSISYRLGFDGFGWIADAPHNRAVLDWLLALEWVRGNIAAFGGDPDAVTIVGQSAGGAAVLRLLALPAAQHLFRAVWSISGPIGDVSLERAEAAGRRLAELGGVEPTRAGLSTLTEERILELQKTMGEPGGGSPLDALRGFIDDGLPWGPVVDGDVVPHGALQAITAGVGADKPLVVGATDDEFSMVLKDAPGWLRFVPAGLLLGKAGLSGPRRKAWLAANRDVAGTAAKVGRYITDSLFRTAVVRVVRARTEAALAAPPALPEPATPPEPVALPEPVEGAAPTWAYRFSWRSPAWGLAVHCVDVPFFFDCLDSERVDALAGPTPPQALADAVHGDAAAFVRTGTAPWAPFADAASVRVYDTPSSTRRNAYASVEPLIPTAS